MSKVTISICDICRTEQRSDTDVYWAQRFGGPVICDFKSVPGNQRKIEFQTLCRTCADELTNAIYNTQTKIKDRHSVNKNGNES